MNATGAHQRLPTDDSQRAICCGCTPRLRRRKNAATAITMAAAITATDFHLPLPVIERPVVVVEFKLDASARGKQSRFFGRSKAPQKADFAAAPLFEVVAEPVHDLGRVDDDDAVALLDPQTWSFGELANLIIELLIDARAGIRLRPNRRTASGSAVDGEVDARIVKAAADSVVLDRVQRDGAASEWHCIFLENVHADERIGGKIADRGNGIMLDDGGDDVHVIKVDPVCELLLRG